MNKTGLHLIPDQPCKLPPALCEHMILTLSFIDLSLGTHTHIEALKLQAGDALNLKTRSKLLDVASSLGS